jgi:hypothetical protein
MKTNIWTIIKNIGIVGSLIVGVWLVDDRFTSATELKQSEKNVYMVVEQSEKNINLCMEKNKRDIYMKMDVNEYRILTKEYYKYKELCNRNPNDAGLRRQLQAIEKERKAVKDRIDRSLRDGG